MKQAPALGQDGIDRLAGVGESMSEMFGDARHEADVREELTCDAVLREPGLGGRDVG